MYRKRETNEVDIEIVDALCDVRKKINRISVQDLILLKKGKEIKIPKQARDDFEFTGLSTVDFISSRYWRK